MRIAIDVRSLMEGRHSGVEEYTSQLIWAMLKVAPEHEYLLFYNSWGEAKVPEFTGEAVEMIGRKFPNKLLNASQFLLKWPRWDRLVRQADVFFLPNARILPLSPELPLVVTAHDLSYERFPEYYSRRRRIWHKLMQPKKLMRRAEKVIAVSQATADDVMAIYGISRDRVMVIHSGTTEPVIEGEDRDWVRKQIKKPYILYFGTLEPRKNVLSVVEAWSAIANSTPHDLVIAGSSGWLTQEVEKAIADSPRRERIIQLGFVPKKRVAALYAEADLFVYPSFYEGFGFPPLEALLAGTPVITSHNSSLPEVSGKWVTMINPYDVAELALVMKEMVTDDFRVDERIKAAIKQRYNWERCAIRTLDVLEQAK